jgi:hypothetical protein
MGFNWAFNGLKGRLVEKQCKGKSFAEYRNA